MPALSPEMIKMASQQMSKMSPEEIERMKNMVIYIIKTIRQEIIHQEDKTQLQPIILLSRIRVKVIQLNSLKKLRNLIKSKNKPTNSINPMNLKRLVKNTMRQ